MRNFSIFALAPVVLMAGAILSTPAIAAKADAVMKACDNVAAAGGSCTYNMNPAGDVYGCAQAKGSTTKTCFVCASGGECVAALRGKPGKNVVTTIGGIKLPPAPPKGRGGLTPPPTGLLEGGTGVGPQGPAPTGGRRGTPSGGTGTIY